MKHKETTTAAAAAAATTTTKSHECLPVPVDSLTHSDIKYTERIIYSFLMGMVKEHGGPQR